MQQLCLVQINCSHNGSTGTIMNSIHAAAVQSGWRSYTICVGTKQARAAALANQIYIRQAIERGFYRKFNKLTGRYGLGFPLATRELLAVLDRLKPDLLQLHNLHHHFFDIGSLFTYIKKHDIRVVWTLHDCWPFTGLCTHFQISGCKKWQIGCYKCPSLRGYPTIYLDQTKKLYSLKKKWFCSVPHMQLVATSEWMAGLVKQSFLKDYSVSVLHHGIDHSVFRPTSSALAYENDWTGKFVVLGVAFIWSYAKGIDVYASLAEHLDESYQIVLVGEIPEGYQLPPNVCCLGKIADKRKIAELFSAADVFFNPTREEALGLVNVESLACQTPVVTFRTGGTAECVDETCGVLLDDCRWEAAYEVIRRMRNGELRFSSEACTKKSMEFTEQNQQQTYLEIYRRMTEPDQE